MTRYGRKIIRVTLAVRQKVDTIPERANSPICFLKVIPSVQVDSLPDVLELNSLLIDPDVITELRVGEGTLEFGDAPYDSFLAKIPVRQVVCSEVIVHDFTLGYGELSPPARLRIATQQITARANPAGIRSEPMFRLYLRRLVPLNR